MIRCDMCTRPGVTYTLGLPGATIDVDLCDSHAQPLHQIADRGRPAMARRVPRARDEAPIRLSDPGE